MNRALVKVLRDLVQTRGRVLFMVLAMSAGLSSLGTVLSARTVLKREMARSYMDTLPASATFDVGNHGIDDRLAATLLAKPEVEAVSRRSTRAARWRPPGAVGWNGALLFVVNDFERLEVAKLAPEYGLRVPPVGTVLVERSALRVLEAEVGDSIEVTTGHAGPVLLQIVGVVYEPALAPAATEQAGYLYASVQTLALLKAPRGLDEVRVLLTGNPQTFEAIEPQVERLSEWLAAQGVTVHNVRVPPPGEHPHEVPSQVVLLLFSVFAGLTVGLAAILCASLLSITMARQVREIAVMKTIGASSAQISTLYIVMMTIVSLLSLAIAVVPTWVLSRVFIDGIATLLNFNIESYAVPGWVYATQIAVGFVLPLLASVPAILSASRVSVLEAGNQHGARTPNGSTTRWLRSVDNRIMQAALRNTLRVPKRLLLTMTLLGAGGGLFIAASSVANAWAAMTNQVLKTRHYDVEFRLAGPAGSWALRRQPEVAEVEVWGFAPAALASKSGLPLSRTYPDGGHGSFTLAAVPRPTRLIDFELSAGRWLGASDSNEVVLNQLAAARWGPHPLGSDITMFVHGRRTTWTVVGVVLEVAASATAYVAASEFVAQTAQPLTALRVRIQAERDPKEVADQFPRLEQGLREGGARIVAAVPRELLFNAMGQHVNVLVNALLGLALLMAIVSVLALSSTMSTSVIERTREFAVLRAIGASSRQIRRIILFESLTVTVMSLPLSLGIAVPLAVVLGQVVGRLSFAIPLSLHLSWPAIAGWTLGILGVATLASLVPAKSATAGSVAEALTHV